MFDRHATRPCQLHQRHMQHRPTHQLAAPLAPGQLCRGGGRVSARKLRRVLPHPETRRHGVGAAAGSRRRIQHQALAAPCCAGHGGAAGCWLPSYPCVLGAGRGAGRVGWRCGSSCLAPDPPCKHGRHATWAAMHAHVTPLHPASTVLHRGMCRASARASSAVSSLNQLACSERGACCCSSPANLISRGSPGSALQRTRRKLGLPTPHMQLCGCHRGSGQTH